MVSYQTVNFKRRFLLSFSRLNEATENQNLDEDWKAEIETTTYLQALENLMDFINTIESLTQSLTQKKFRRIFEKSHSIVS